MERRRRLLAVYLLVTALIVMTTMALSGVLDCGFVNYDDPIYVTQNDIVKAGLTLHGVSWAITNTYFGCWHPLTLLSHMLDCQLFGLNPMGHHLTSLILHLGSTVLLFLILLRTTGALWRSFFVAALFGIHPMHVESVAWIAERKDVLSTFFCMLTIAAYLRYVQSASSIRRYLTVVLLFALGLTAKAMLVTLPFVLLLMDYWPLGRFQPGQEYAGNGLSSPKEAGSRHGIAQMTSLIKEKIPLFILASVFSLVTYRAQATLGAVGPLSLDVRFSNALSSYVIYLWKMIRPDGLTCYYPHPLHAMPPLLIVGAVMLLTAVTLAAVITIRQIPYLFVGWCWYLGTLVPVSGLVQVGSHGMADRYTYLPFIGLFIIVAWGFADLSRRWRYRSMAAGVLAGVVLLILALMTRIQTGYWKDDDSLYQHALQVNERNHVAHINLATSLLLGGQLEGALNHLNRAIEIEPGSAEAYHDLGIVLQARGKEQEALRHFEKALEIDPNRAKTHLALGLALSGRGQFDRAILHFKEVLRIDPSSAQALEAWGNALASQGKFDQAVVRFSEVQRLKPNDPQIYYKIGVALEKEGNHAAAADQFTTVLRLNPESAEAHARLGIILAGNDRFKEAESHFLEALRLQPGSEKARHNLEILRARQKEAGPCSSKSP